MKIKIRKNRALPSVRQKYISWRMRMWLDLFVVLTSVDIVTTCYGFSLSTSTDTYVLKVGESNLRFPGELFIAKPILIAKIAVVFLDTSLLALIYWLCGKYGVYLGMWIVKLIFGILLVGYAFLAIYNLGAIGLIEKLR